MPSNYPNQVDLFETKHNATSANDPAGDYVMAEHVNDLQDSIVAIESTLGANPQGSSLNVADRLTKLEGISLLRVPPILVYLGSPAAINGSASIDEAAEHFVKYDHVVLGPDLEQDSSLGHIDAISIINKVHEDRSVSFYGYIDCSISTETVSEIQVRINKWKDMGVAGIYCANFGYDKGVSRERQNLILDSIHQYDLTAILDATNPDDVLSDTADTTYNPDWVVPNIQVGDIYHLKGFAVNTSAGSYQNFADLHLMMDKLIGFRDSIGIRIFGTSIVNNATPANTAQGYFDYVHAVALLYSLDGFYSASPDYGQVSGQAKEYSWSPLIGAWYTKTPNVTHTGNIYKRMAAFGEITVNATDHSHEITGGLLASTLIREVDNSLDGTVLKDNSVPDEKIISYNGSRIIGAINTSTGSYIDISKITGLFDETGGIDEGYLQANVLSAMNAKIGSLDAQTAAIGVLTAEEIITGELKADRLTAAVIYAINIAVGHIEAGNATIHNAAIDVLTAGHIEAAVIEAININAKGAQIENLDATKITAGDIAADRMRANAVTAINLYASTIQAGDARINTAAIGELTADHIKAKVIEAINLSTDTAVIHSARIQELTADHIKGVVVEAINLNATTALIDSAKIGVITADKLTANVVEAINLAAESATIDGARIRNLNADYITAGSIAADRMTANVIDAVNLKAGVATVGAAIINSAAIGTISAAHIQAAVITAINTSIESATINAARIGVLTADNIGAGTITAEKIAVDAITADKIDANAVTAEKIAAGAVEADKLAVNSVTAEKIVAGAVETDKLAADAVTAEKIAAGSIEADHLTVNAVQATHIQAGAISTNHLAASAVTTEKIAAGAITADLIKAVVIEAVNLSASFINGNRIQARTIDANRIIANSITSSEIAAGAITATTLAAGAVTADKVAAGTIESQHISTGGLDAQIINVYNSTTGEVLIGGGFLRVDGLDVGVVQSDNLLVNGLFLTASSSYGLWRKNQAGEVILGSQTDAPGSHQVWKIDTATGTKVAEITIAGKKPFGIAFDAIEQYAYVTVQGDETIVQLDMTNNVITDKFLKSTGTPGRVIYTGMTMTDHKHFLVLGTDPDDQTIPDSLMIVDASPTSINSALYMHHVIPLGNNPYDAVMDSNHNIYITMHEQGDIVIVEAHGVNSLYWKVAGRIPISAYMTDNYHGGLPGEVGFNMVTGGSAAIAYQKDSGHSGHMHSHGGYGSADGSLKEYKPKGIALSSDPEILYVVDAANNQLVVVNKFGKGFYNPLTGTREKGNLGQWGTPSKFVAPSQGGSNPDSGGVHEHSTETTDVEFTIQTLPMPPAPLPPELMDPTPQTSGQRDYANTNGETNYVHYRIDIGDSPERVVVHEGKIFVTLTGSNQVAIIDESEVIDALTADRAYYYNEFADWPTLPHFMPRYIEVGSRPMDIVVDSTNDKLYVALTGQNQIAVIDTVGESVLTTFNCGANPRDMALTQDGTTLYVVNHGGSGTLSFVYDENDYIGDAYIGLEGDVNHHGAHGWMPNRSDWTHNVDGSIKSSSVIEFRINEPFLNEGGYVRMAAQGTEYQWATIEQDILNVVNYSDGTNPAGTWFKFHNGSAQVAIANGSSPNFVTKFEIDEFVPKFIVYDNQQTTSFTPTVDGIDDTYDGLEYSGITNRAHMAVITSSVAPTSGTLMDIVDNKEPIDTEEEEGGHGGHMMSAPTDEPVFTVQHTFGDTAVFPSGLQNVTIDLGDIYMIGKIVVMHDFHTKTIFHGTKTEVSVDGVEWVAVFDSAVDGEYPEYEEHIMGDMTHRVYGNHIVFPAQPVRYVRDWANGYALYDANWANPVEYTENHWTEIKVYGDWKVIYNEVYPPNTDKAGQPLASNGECYVSTDVTGAWVAHDIPIEFTSWSWMTFIAGPQNGTIAVEMPTLMASDHFVDQQWPYKTNIPHRHTMVFPPSINVKEDASRNIKAGKHRLILKQVSGVVTIDRLKYEDFQYYARSSTLVPASSGATFRRFKIVAEQAKAYQGIGRQSTEGAYDEPRRSPDSGLPDKSVPIKYRFRIKTELNANGSVEERGIAYITSCIMETGKLSSHWRMSQSGDLFPGTRIEAWDPNQPHKTGIQNHHLANGAVRGSTIMANSIMNHHISPYARIPEFKLDLNWRTHGHGRWTYPMGPMMPIWEDNKAIIDEILGWGRLVDDGMGMMVEDEHSGTLDRLARADHDHNDKYPETTGTPGEGKVPVFRAAISKAEWSLIGWNDIGSKPTTFPPEAHDHTVADITDLTANYYNKSEVDALIESGGGDPGGGTGDVVSTADNNFTGTNTFSKPGLAIKIQPSSATPAGTKLFEILNSSAVSQFSVTNNGIVNGVTMTMSGAITAGSFSSAGSASFGSLTISGASSLSTLSVSSTATITGALTLGTQATTVDHAVRADRTITAGNGLTGGGDLTQNRTLAVNFAGSGVANTAARSDHGHAGYLTTGADQSVGNNFTVIGILYAGSGSTSGDIIVRNASAANVIHLDGDSSGKIDPTNTKVYIAGNGNGDFAGTVKINTLQVTNTGVVTNLNAEKINGVAEKDLVKNASIEDLTGYGVDYGLQVVAQTIPNMTVKVEAGVAYTSSGRRFVYGGTDNVSLQNSSTNFDRYDVIYIHGASSGANEGTLAVATGTPASPALEPAIPSDAIKLAVILVKQNVGTITDGTSSSFDAIADARKFRDLRHVGGILQNQGHIRVTNGATKVTIPAGQTSVTWTHNYGGTNYAVAPFGNSPARHIHYKNLTANSIDICIDDAHTSGIDVLLILVGY